MANEKETDASIAKLNDDLKKNFASNGTGSMAANCETVVKQFWLSHVFVPVVYMLIFVVGVIGNGLVVWLMVKKNNRGRPGYQRSVTNLYVLNLAIADLIFVGFLPFWTVASISEKNWLFGAFGCKILTFITLLNLYGSVFFLVGMGIDRYFAIVLPIKSQGHRTRKNALRACVAIWILACLVASKAFALRKVSKDSVDPCPLRYVCHWEFYDSKELEIAYFVVRTGLGFFLPLIIILFCYIFIFISLKRRNQRTAGLGMRIPDQKITRLILWVIGMFIICWLPNHVLNVYFAVVSMGPSAYSINYTPIQCAFSITSCFAYANSSCNPVLYAFMKDDMKTQLFNLASRYFGYRTSSTSGGVNSEASSPQTKIMKWSKKNSRKNVKDDSKTSDILSPPATPLTKTDDASGNLPNMETTFLETADFKIKPKSTLVTASGDVLVAMDIGECT